MTLGGHPIGDAPIGSTSAGQVDRPAPVPSRGWHATVTHPETGRVIRLEVLDQPTILPSLNRLPEIRVPVRKSDVWLLPEMDDNPDMDVWRDGAKQPIDELRNIEHREGRTILTGVGGVELEQRVQAEYSVEQRHVAAADLVADTTSYDTDFDAPVVDTLSGRVLQNPQTTAEFEALLNIDDATPLRIDSDIVEARQSCFPLSFGDLLPNGEAFGVSGGDYEDGDAWSLEPENGSEAGEISGSFTLDYDLPLTEDDTDRARIAMRYRLEDGSDPVSFIITFGGESVGTASVASTSFEWTILTEADLGALPADTYSVGIDRFDTSTPANANLVVDMIAVYDNRYDYTFDNDLSESGGWLDGPELYPDAVEVGPTDALTPFAVDAAEASLSIDGVSNGQRLQASNDRGQTWSPSDGTEDNTDSVDVSFSGFGSTLRLRTDLSRHAPSGAQDETPRLGYDSQTISEWTVEADLRLETLLFERNFDDSLASVLTEIAGDEYLWSVNLDADGDYQVSWVQPGQRTADRDPDIGDARVEKSVDVYETVTIKGSPRRVSDETIQADVGATVSLDNANLVTGSETVYDDSGAGYDRTVDYEMDYRNGTITPTDAGSIADGSDLTVDYSVEVEGSYTVQDASPDPREFVENVSSVVSETGAEQIAYVLATEYGSPRWSATLTIPREDVTFDPLEALTLDNLDLPDQATPLDVREQPEITPSGIQVRLGTRDRMQAALDSLAQQVSQVSRRS